MKKRLTKVYACKRKDNINPNKEYDSLIMFYRDEDGSKKSKFISRGESEFYILKDKTAEDSMIPKMFIEESKLDKVVCFSDNLYREIANRTDCLPYYDRILLNYGERSQDMKNLFKHPYIYNADMDISDKYIADFNEKYDTLGKDVPLYKGYFDIEVDLMPDGFKNKGYSGFPNEDVAPCPINIITFIDGVSLSSYSFVCRNENNKSLVEFENKVEDFKSYLLDKISKEDKTVLNSININFYNSEEETIEGFFNKIHDVNPDYMLAWNEGFDCKTLMNRLEKLYSRKKYAKDKSIRPRDKMVSTVCDNKYFIHEDELTGEKFYLTPKLWYKQESDKPITDRTDSFTILDGIVWLDQMVQYASIRKSGGQKDSYALDAIAYEELGKEKLPFGPGETIKNLPWKNFWKFAEYNIRDVLLLYLLESKNMDVDLMQTLSEVTNTRIERVFRKTLSLKNLMCKFGKSKGMIMGNNQNATYGKDGDYFKNTYVPKNDIIETDPAYKVLIKRKDNFGAMVGDPLLNDPEGIIGINGKKSMYLFEDVCDQDFSALYPSIIRALNLDSTTQVGKFLLHDNTIKKHLSKYFKYDDSLFTVSKNQEADDDGEEITDLSMQLTDSLQSFDVNMIGQKFFLLPSTEQLINKFKETH